MHGGGVGVDVFFVLSGFLITTLLVNERERTGRVALGKFWGRRALRLMPALIVVLVVFNTIGLIFSDGQDSQWQRGLIATPFILLYVSNWLILFSNGPALGVFGPMWSLSVEEQFYLVWPVIVIAFVWQKVRSRHLLLFATAVAVLVAMARFWTFDGATIFRTFGTDFRVDMLLIGCILALILHLGHAQLLRRLSRFAVWPSAIFLVVVMVSVPEFGAEGAERAEYIYYTVGLPIVGVATAVIIAFCATHQRSGIVAFLSWPPMVYLGTISYGLYLWHYPITILVNSIFRLDANVVLIVVLLLTIASATMSWILVERPLSRRFHRTLQPTDLVDSRVS
jgi:peptidoglycan/LPS O-acetylase OafA/YrhL